ncbi:hypothetical protein OG203_19740 [Nocardia sp. NBC_01499]|uniref:hypothetical protein n=1 Tax=Nocardia sp. NBC_01499 TaxID=2903597 RepID=UPI00386A401E
MPIAAAVGTGLHACEVGAVVYDPRPDPWAAARNYPVVLADPAVDHRDHAGTEHRRATDPEYFTGLVEQHGPAFALRCLDPRATPASTSAISHDAPPTIANRD